MCVLCVLACSSLSLDEFQELIHRIDPDKPPSDVVRLFREATAMRAPATAGTDFRTLRRSLSRASLRSSNRTTPHTSRRGSARAGAGGAGAGDGSGGGGGDGSSGAQAERDDANAVTKRQFMHICRKYGLATAAIKGDLRVPASVDKRALPWAGWGAGAFSGTDVGCFGVHSWFAGHVEGVMGQRESPNRGFCGDTKCVHRARVCVCVCVCVWVATACSDATLLVAQAKLKPQKPSDSCSGTTSSWSGSPRCPPPTMTSTLLPAPWMRSSRDG